MTVILFTAALACVCFAYFTWGIAAHFRRDGPMPVGMLAIVLTSWAFFAWFLGDQSAGARSGMRAPMAFNAVAIALMTAAAALFHWTVVVNRARPLTLAFSCDQPSFIQRTGPYAYVRHPLYLSYIVFWVGTAIASGRLAHWLAPASLALLYHRAANLEEAKFARSSLAREYSAYQATTGMVLPLPWRRFPG